MKGEWTTARLLRPIMTSTAVDSGDAMEYKGTGARVLRPVMTSAAVPKEQQQGC